MVTVTSNESSDARTKVCVLYTGGTFGMVAQRPEQPESPLVPASKEHLFQALAGLGSERGIAWDLRSLTDREGTALAPLDSAEVGPKHWLAIAVALESHYHDYDGFVVLHGTDTLAYTASALSFLLVNLSKPVVLTGSQAPIFSERNDALPNFLNALYVAGYKATSVPLIPEVMIAFGDLLLRGNRARKISVDARTGFRSPNYPPLGTFGQSISIDRKRIRQAPPPDRPFYVHRRLEEKVMDLTLFPGVQGEALSPLFEREDLSGFVLRTFGSGTTPRDPELLECVATAARCGKLLLVVTQCLEGAVDLGRYDASSNLLESGVISGFDLTPEAALTKLMWMLALEKEGEREDQIQISHRGEQSYDHHLLPFGACQTSTIASLSRRPTCPFQPKHLRRALLRVRGAQGADLRFFLNSSGIEPDTPSEDVRCLGQFSPQDGNGVVDVTRALKRLLVPNRPLRMTVTGGGEPFSFERCDLSLLVGSDG